MVNDQEKRAAVLLKEYDALRAESLARIRARFEFVAGTGVLAGFLLNHSGRWFLWQRAAILVLSVAAVAVFAYLHLAVARCHRALVFIEDRVNKLYEGERLLSWETSLDGSFFARAARGRH